MTLQVLLGAACGYLSWSVVAALVWAAPVPERRVEAVELPPPARPALEEYAAIHQRDLFRSATFQKPVEEAPEPEEEELVESRLRVKLYGTAATDPPEFSVAAVEDLSTREVLNVHVGDTLQGAIVRRIERKRIVVENRGRLEEIVVDEELEVASAPVRAATRRSASGATMVPQASVRRAERVAQRVRKLSERFTRGTAPAPSPEEQEQLRRRREQIVFREAEIRPDFEKDTMTGWVLTDVPSGSKLAAAGLLKGDVVRTVNGTSIASVGKNYDTVSKMMEGTEFTLEVERGDDMITIEVGR